LFNYTEKFGYLQITKTPALKASVSDTYIE